MTVETVAHSALTFKGLLTYFQGLLTHIPTVAAQRDTPSPSERRRVGQVTRRSRSIPSARLFVRGIPDRGDWRFTPTWTHARERAAFAVGHTRVAGPPAVAQQVHVQLQLLSRRRQREHLIVKLLKRRPRPQQTQTGPDARDMRID